MEKLWSVIMFYDDSCVATVPKSWLFEGSDGEDLSYWPPKNKSVSTLVKKNEKPDRNWPQFRVKIMGFYDKYETAVKKTKTAEETSDLSSAAEGKKRKRKRNIFYSDDEQLSSDEVSDKDTTDEENTKYPKLPSVSGIKNNKILFNTHINQNGKKYRNKTEQFQTQDVQCSAVEGTSSERNLQDVHGFDGERESSTPINSPQVLHPPSSSRNSSQLLSDSDNFEKKVLRKLNTISAKLSQHEERFDTIEKLLELRRNGQESETENSSLKWAWFPIDSDMDLAMVEQYLDKKEHFIYLTKELSRIGGDSVDTLTRKIMYRIMTSELGQLYSWEGGKGKRKFVDLLISQVVIKSVRLNLRTREASDDQVIKVIKQWLAKAKERVLNKAKKSNKSADAQEDLTGSRNTM